MWVYKVSGKWGSFTKYRKKSKVDNFSRTDQNGKTGQHFTD